ncbi:MAG: choice-of-anchor E domain-containing protein [Caldilineaceae bacterium]
MSAMLTRAVRNACFFAALLVFGWIGAARAESIVYTDTIPIQPMDFTDTLTLPKFDPTIGILTGVQITLTGEITGSAYYTNIRNTNVLLSLQAIGSEELGLLDQTKLVASSPLITISGSLPPGFSASQLIARTVSQNQHYSAESALLPYTGIGAFTLPFTATSSFMGSGVANIAIELRTDARATGSIRYIYAIPQIQLKKFTNGFDADQPNDADVPQLHPGDPITWTYLLTNTGSITIPLADIVVTDSQLGVTPVRVPTSDANNDGLLSPGEVWLYRAIGVVQNLDAPAGNITVVAGCNPGGTAAPGDRATYRNIGQVTVPGATSSDPSHYCNTPNPGIAIKKLTNGADANNPNDNDVPQITPGATVTWTYIVTNTGDITFSLAQVQVTDNQPGVTPVWMPSSDAHNDQLLSPGETWRYQATGIAQNLKTATPGVNTELGCNPTHTTVPGNRLTYFNIGQVNVPGATDSDPSHYCNPPVANIALQKTVYKGHNQGGFCPGGELVVDSQDNPVTYCFVITNTGETYLSNLKLVDNDLGVTLSNMTLLSGTTPLAPGAKLFYFYETTLKQNLLNLATVTGHPTDNQGQTIPGLADPTAKDTAEVQILPTAIDLVYISLESDQSSVTLRWAKLPTHDTAGYHIYRSATNQRSSAVRITNQLVTGHIENKGDAGTLVSYAFADLNVQASDTYYYWLVEVKLDGSTNESGPLQVKRQSPEQNYRIFLPEVSHA